jgi:hypothetical protein
MIEPKALRILALILILTGALGLQEAHGALSISPFLSQFIRDHVSYLVSLVGILLFSLSFHL